MMKPTYKQERAINAICRSYGLNAEAMCRKIVGCGIDALTVATASRLIGELKRRIAAGE
jgi:hypothetical protein